MDIEKFILVPLLIILAAYSLYIKNKEKRKASVKETKKLSNEKIIFLVGLAALGFFAITMDLLQN